MVRAHDAGDAMFIIAKGEAVVEISPSRQIVQKRATSLARWRCSSIGVTSMTWSPRRAAGSMCSIADPWARLGCHHPELIESIRKMAEARAVDDEPSQREDRKRKVGAKD